MPRPRVVIHSGVVIHMSGRCSGLVRVVCGGDRVRLGWIVTDLRQWMNCDSG